MRHRRRRRPFPSYAVLAQPPPLRLACGRRSQAGRPAKRPARRRFRRGSRPLRGARRGAVADPSPRLHRALLRGRAALAPVASGAARCRGRWSKTRATERLLCAQKCAQRETARGHIDDRAHAPSPRAARLWRRCAHCAPCPPRECARGGGKPGGVWGEAERPAGAAAAGGAEADCLEKTSRGADGFLLWPRSETLWLRSVSSQADVFAGQSSPEPLRRCRRTGS